MKTLLRNQRKTTAVSSSPRKETAGSFLNRAQRHQTAVRFPVSGRASAAFALLRLAALAFASIGLYGATTLTAKSSVVNAGGTDQLSLTIDPSIAASSAQVKWTVWPAVGSVSSSGLYTAPANVTKQQTVKVVALVVPTVVSQAPVVVYSLVTINPAQ
jgi:hypothetical protein